VWPNCQTNTPVLYTFLQRFYYGEASPPRTPPGNAGWLWRAFNETAKGIPLEEVKDDD